LAKYTKMTADAICSLMEFAYPKLARVDYAGDAPKMVEDKMVVTLQITDTPPAFLNGGPKTIEHDDGCGEAARHLLKVNNGRPRS
jgi:hypothetical protein